MEKRHKNVNLSEKKSEASVKKTQKCKFRWWFIVSITESKYLDQDSGDGLRTNHYHCFEIHQSAAQFDYILHEIGNRVRGYRWTWTPLSGT